MPHWTVLLVAEPAYFIAYVIFAMVGFGTTLVAAPLVAHVIPLPTLVPAQALMDLIASVGNGIRLNAHVARGEVYRLVPAMLLGSVIGAYALFAVPIKFLMLTLGVFVTLYAANNLRPKHLPPPISGHWAWWYGTTGGALSALFGAGAWVNAIYLMRRLEDPQAVRATQMVLVIVSAVIRVGIFAAAGMYMDVDLLILSACLWPAMILGMYVGNRINLRMNRQRFLRVLNLVLLVTGSGLMLRAFA
jgi:Predicted permeases